MNIKEAVELLERIKPSNFTGRELNNVREEKIKEEKLSEVIELLLEQEVAIDSYKYGSI